MQEQLRQLAAKYLWWEQPAGVPHDTRRLFAQVMDIGTHEDAEAIREALGDDALKEVLRAAEPGWFSAKSWHYWHYVLGLATVGGVPALPQRRYS